MKKTYVEAAEVPVLDRSLQSSAIEELATNEACARILASGWIVGSFFLNIAPIFNALLRFGIILILISRYTVPKMMEMPEEYYTDYRFSQRRLWTLQESAYPAAKQRRWFQFRDRVVNIIQTMLKEIIITFEKEPDQRGLAGNIINGISAFAAFFKRNVDYPGTDLSSIEAGLRYRSVIAASDEALPIANLLDLDVAAIVNSADTSHSGRMRQLWSMIPDATRGIPKDVLFRVGPRLPIDGSRWAPATMLHADTANFFLNTMRPGENRGIPSPRGPFVTLTGYKFSLTLPTNRLLANPWGILWSRSGNLLRVRDEKGTWLVLDRRLPSEQTDYMFDRSLQATVEQEPCLWLVHVPVQFDVARQEDTQQTTIGLLVNLVEEENGIKYVQSKLHVRLSIVMKSTATFLDAAYQSAHEVYRSPAGQD